MSEENNKQQEQVSTEKPKNVGGRNLIILGVSSIALAILSSGISLFIYHETGDIYLDRSRPGFISEDEDNDESTEDEPVVDFSQEGSIDDKILEEYLQNFDKKVKTNIEKYSDAFSENALSDDTLNLIPPDSE